jgi:hypothetical protein
MLHSAEEPLDGVFADHNPQALICRLLPANIGIGKSSVND